jgi:hypothetical protein
MSEFSMSLWSTLLIQATLPSPIVLVKIQNGRPLACCLLVAGGVTAIVSIILILTDSDFFCLFLMENSTNH